MLRLTLRRAACFAVLLAAGACGASGAGAGDRTGPDAGGEAPDGGGAAHDGAPEAGASCLPQEITDPYFMISSDWTATGPVTIAPGTATFTDQTRCEYGGVGQTLPPLPVSCSQPLVIKVRTTYGMANPPGDTGALGVRINGGWNFIEPPQAIDAANTLCLGTRLFGGAGDLFLGGGTQPLGCDEPGINLGRGALEVNGVSIGPDVTKACPPFGEVANGDFEGGPAGWSLVAANGTAEIVAGAGATSSHAARIATTELCQQPRIKGLMSIPLARDVPNPALHVWSTATDQTVVSVLVGPGPAHQTLLVGSGDAVEQNICIPRWAQGTVQPISFRFLETDGVCARPAVRELVVDDFSFVSDPSCADADLLDPGFEWAALPTGRPSFWVPKLSSDATVEVRVDPASAHTGVAAAVLSASGPCSVATLQGDVTIPTELAGAGTALAFWYRTGGLVNSRIEIGLSALLAPVALDATTAWTRVSACLNHRLAGRPDRLTFVLRGGGGECAAMYDAPDTLSIDDVELTTDPACP